MADYNVVDKDSGKEEEFRPYIVGQRSCEAAVRDEKKVVVLITHLDEETEAACPFCGKRMVKNGTASRKVCDDGVEYQFTVVQFRCRNCEKKRRESGNTTIQYTHRLLPENMFPYKRTVMDVMIVCGQMGELTAGNLEDDNESAARIRTEFDEKCCQADESTLAKWRIWYLRFRTWLAGELRSLAHKLGVTRLRELAEAISNMTIGTGQMELAVRWVLEKKGRVSI